MGNDWSRRKFLQTTAGGIALAACGGSGNGNGDQPDGRVDPDVPAGSTTPRVVVVKANATIDASTPPTVELVTSMLAAGVSEFTGIADPAQAWSSLVKPTDRVVSPYSGSILTNVPSFSIAVYQSLLAAGVTDLTIGAHRPPSSWLTAVQAGMGADMPPLVSGPDSGEDLFGIASLPVDVLVTTPTLKRHMRAGVSGTLKHYATFGSSGPMVHHVTSMRSCSSVVMSDFANVRKLHFVDMIRVGTEGEVTNVSPPSGFVFTKAIVIGSDPVAVDRVAMDLYLTVGIPDRGIDPMIHVYAGQTDYGAGIADLAQIDVRTITV